MKRRLFLLFVVSMGAAAPGWAADQSNPAAIVHQQTDRILGLIRTKRAVYQQHPAQLYAMVQKQVLPYFDFRLMSRWVLGRYWHQATPQQKSAFANEFQALLVRTYATALLSYTGQKVTYLPFHGDLSGKTAVVRTVVQQNNGGSDIPVDYSFYKEPTGWKVYDVTIDRVSLVTNYRMTYASKVQRQGLDALIASLKRLNQGGS